MYVGCLDFTRPPLKDCWMSAIFVKNEMYIHDHVMALGYNFGVWLFGWLDVREVLSTRSS